MLKSVRAFYLKKDESVLEEVQISGFKLYDIIITQY